MVVPRNLPFSQSLLIGWFPPAAGRVGSLEEGSGDGEVCRGSSTGVQGAGEESVGVFRQGSYSRICLVSLKEGEGDLMRNW